MTVVVTLVLYHVPKGYCSDRMYQKGNRFVPNRSCTEMVPLMYLKGHVPKRPLPEKKYRQKGKERERKRRTKMNWHFHPSVGDRGVN